MKKTIICLIISIVIYSQNPLFGCSTFLFYSDNNLFVGHNLDQDFSLPGHLIINKRGVLKSNICWNEILRGEDENNKRVRWISKYGSVTFNPGGGKEFPDGGLNEAGLVVCEMSLPQTQYPQNSGAPKMFTWQWIQYLLDNYGSVQEVINNVNEFELTGFVRWHFFVADKIGDVAIIEFINNKVIVYSGSEVLFPVLGNSTYADELEYISSFEGFGGTEIVDLNNNEDKNRFVKAAYMLKNHESISNVSPVDYGFDILKTIGFNSSNEGDIITRWSIIYDIRNSRVLFKTDKADKIKYLDFRDVDFSCQTESKVYNLDNPKGNGDISELLINYDISKSKKCLNALWKTILSNESFLERVLGRRWATRGMLNYSSSVYCEK